MLCFDVLVDIQKNVNKILIRYIDIMNTKQFIIQYKPEFLATEHI